MSAAERPGPGTEMTQLLPEPRTVTVGELTSGLDLAARAPADRPYVVVNFVVSADGRTAFRGRSGGLSDPGDRAMFHGLRESVDAILAGTTTMREEGYGRMVPDPARRRRREQAGLAADPLAVVISRSGDVPVEIPLFADPDSRVVVFSPTSPVLRSGGAAVEVVQGQLTLAEALGRLRAERSIGSLLCEGGATMFSSLLRQGLVDELFLTMAPKLAGGGEGPALTRGPELPELAGLRLLWVLERGGSLFLRYAVVRD